MLLSAIVFTPILFGLFVLVTPKAWVRPVSLALSLVHFALCILMMSRFDIGTASIQMSEMIPWLESVGISYFLGVDGISIWLVMLSSFLVPLTILGSWTSIKEREHLFHFSLFMLATTMMGTFLAFDLILFYVFFEASLIPMYLMIGIWGGARRLYATMKFFIYTMFGSLFMLLGIISLMLIYAGENGGELTSNLVELYKMNIPFVAGDGLGVQSLLFFGFCLAFAIKVPMFPFHTWLPDAHVEAPTPGSVILAGVMLKMGTYGFIRLALPLFPEAASYWAWLFLFLGVFGIIYGALVAMVQTDIKKLVAYSSVSHMGYVVIGIFSLNELGLTGGLYQMLNHGVSTGALFLLVGMIYERTHSREISKYGGLAKAAPLFAILFVIFTMSSIAVPMTNGFVGEFLILLGAFKAHGALGSIAVLGVVLGAAYMLWMVKRVFFGEESEMVKTGGRQLEVNFREILLLSPLVVLVFWMGLYPSFFLKYSEKSLNHLQKTMGQYELQIVGSEGTSIDSRSAEVK